MILCELFLNPHHSTKSHKIYTYRFILLMFLELASPLSLTLGLDTD